MTGECFDPCAELGLRVDGMDETDGQRLRGVDRLARHHHPSGPVRPDQAGQSADPTGAGDDREVGDLGQGEGGDVRCQPEVAGRAELDPDAEAVRLCGEDHRLLDLLDLVEEVVVGFLAVLPAERRAAYDAVGARADVESKAGDVQPGREVPPLAGDDQDARVVIVREVVDRGRQHLDHPGGQRVELVVPGERDRDHPLAVLSPHAAVAARHVGPPPVRAGLTRWTARSMPPTRRGPHPARPADPRSSGWRP